MNASKFSEAQIAFVLKQAEGDAIIAEVCRKAGIGVATFYNWRKKYAGLMPSEMKRLRQLEDENNRLKKTPSQRYCVSIAGQQIMAASLSVETWIYGPTPTT